MFSKQSRTRKIRIILGVIIIATLPFYCLGLIMLQGQNMVNRIRTATPTETQPAAASNTPRPTWTGVITATASITPSPTITWTPSITPTAFLTPTRTITQTATITLTPTDTLIPPTETPVPPTETDTPSPSEDGPSGNP